MDTAGALHADDYELISITEDGSGETSITCWHTDCYELRDAGWQAVWSQATVINPD